MIGTTKSLSIFLCAELIDLKPINGGTTGCEGECWPLASFPHDRCYNCVHCNFPLTMSQIHSQCISGMYFGLQGATEPECNMRQTFVLVGEHGRFWLWFFLSHVRTGVFFFALVFVFLLDIRTSRFFVFFFSTMSSLAGSRSASFYAIDKVLDILQYSLNRAETAVSGYFQRCQSIRKYTPLL